MSKWDLGRQPAALDLVNSEWWPGHGSKLDRLDEPGWLEAFLAAHGLEHSPTVAVAGLRRLRALLRRVLERIDAAEEPGLSDVAGLNAAMRVPVVRTLEQTSLTLAPVKRDARWARAEIAASLAALLDADGRERLKLCDNTACRFAYYDETKNRSRRWCSSATCGNRHKLRRYRDRKRGRSRD